MILDRERNINTCPLCSVSKKIKKLADKQSTFTKFLGNPTSDIIFVKMISVW